MTIKLACALSLTALSSTQSILNQWVFALLNFSLGQVLHWSQKLDYSFFCFGVLKSMSDTGMYSTVLNDGGSHAQGSEVQLFCCFTWVLASAANSTAAL